MNILNAADEITFSNALHKVRSLSDGEVMAMICESQRKAKESFFEDKHDRRIDRLEFISASSKKDISILFERLGKYDQIISNQNKKIEDLEAELSKNTPTENTVAQLLLENNNLISKNQELKSIILSIKSTL